MGTGQQRHGRSGDSVGPSRDVLLLDRQVQAINRFPDQNPNPVMRMSNDGFLLYANVSSAPIRRAWGVEVGDRLPDDVVSALRAALDQPPERSLQVEHDHRTYSVLAVGVPDLGFVNIYGTDVTAQRVIDKFPDQNPNPVLRVKDGRLIYANRASQPIVDAQRLALGEPIPEALRAEVDACLLGRRREPIEVVCDDRTFELLPVAVPEFGFTNLYGTDVTAVRMIAEANRENERLLLNILPPPIAERLRLGERVIADRFDDATLLIADIVGFTALSSDLPAIDVVKLLNGIFSACDALVEKHGLEKVKTIGDAYMVVGGVPTYFHDHLERVADLALDLAAEVDAMQQDMQRRVSVRIGIHSGPLAAGVIGVKKFIYDVWGDTVNQAARMEALSAPGRIHVTRRVHDRLADRYAFEPRGVIDVKGKGAMATWFLVGRL
jgi:class 3 adenylate cyclase